MRGPLRAAEPGDLELLCCLNAEFYAEAGYPLDEALAGRAIDALIRDPSLGRIWVIEWRHRPVGYVSFTFGYSLEYFGRDAFVDDLYLRKGFRGGGLGTRVMEQVEAYGRQLGVQALHLEVERSNRRAQGLYRKRGFRDNDRQLLTKRLAGPGAARSRARAAGPPTRPSS